ncbi:MAG: phage holin family protein [Muribaculaceae bacterium]|nr:phage holin family protein [Muribaculaceae bacterium]
MAFIAAKLTPGVEITSFWTAILLALVLGLLDVFVKPVLVFLSLPVTILTLGLFLLVINALITLLASWLVSSFQVSGFWSALLYSIIFSVVSCVLGLVFG